MGFLVGLRKVRKKIKLAFSSKPPASQDLEVKDTIRSSDETRSTRFSLKKDSLKDEILLYMAQLTSEELNELVTLSRLVRKKLQGGRLSTGLKEQIFSTTSRLSRQSGGPIATEPSPSTLNAGGKTGNDTYRYTSTTGSSLLASVKSGTMVSSASPGSRMVRHWNPPSSETVPNISSDQAFKLVQKVFPTKVLRQLQWDLGKNIAESHNDVSIFFSDIVGFTRWCSTKSPTTVIECLSAYFQILDDLAERSGVYKVETIGDAWMAICGAPKKEPDHASIMGYFALEVQGTLSDLKEIFCSPDISLRIGLHCGPVQSGVVRADRPRFQVFGDTVNMASRMESTSQPGMIQISQDMHNALKRSSMHFSCTSRGQMEVKGKGTQETFFLNSVLKIYSEPNTPIKFSGDRLTIFNPGSSRRSSAKSDAQDDIQLRDTAYESHEFAFKPMTSANSCTNSSNTARSSHSASFSEDEQMAVLLVDDAASIRMQYRRVLSKTGCKVYTAKNGLEALDLLMQRPFTCVLMDIFMPEINGYECVERFRKWESKHRTWRQSITGLSGEEFSLSMVDDLKERGFDDFVSKNNTTKGILRHVAQYVLDSKLSSLD